MDNLIFLNPYQLKNFIPKRVSVASFKGEK